MLEPYPADAEIWILLVDDDDDDAILVERVLDEMAEAIHFRRAVDGQKAVELLTSAGPGGPVPDIIILDLSMPVMDGHRFLSWLRSDPRFASIVVVILTTSKDRDLLQSLLAKGANAAISKALGEEAVQELSQAILDLWSHGQVNSLAQALESEIPLDPTAIRPVLVASSGLRTQVSHMLSAWGIAEQVQAETGEALSLPPDFHPNVLILEADRAEAASDTLAELSELTGTDQIPVLMFTHQLSRADVADRKGRGVTEFLKLPLSETVLRQRLAHLFRVTH